MRVICPLFLLMMSLSSPLWAQWQEIQTPNFRVISDASDNRAQKVAQHFEVIREVFRNRYPNLRLDDGREKVIWALSGERSMRRFMPKSHPKYNDLISTAYFHEMDFVLVVRLNEPQFTFESAVYAYSYNIIQLNFPYLPTWMKDGLAEYFSGMEVLSDRVNIGKRRHGHQQFKSSSWIPLEELLTMQRPDPNAPGDRAFVYRYQSWMLIHYILMSKEGHKNKLFTKLVQAIGEGKPQLQAVTEVLGPFPELQKKLRLYNAQPRLGYFPDKKAPKLFKQKFPARALTPAEEQSQRLYFWAHSGESEIEEPLLADLMKDPDPKVRVTTAWVLQLLGRTAEATTLAQSVPADQLTWKGHWLLSNAGLSSQEKEKHLEAVVASNPPFSRACADLAQIVQNTDLKRAITLVQQAVEHDPAQLGYSQFLTYLLREAKLEEQAREAAHYAIAIAESDGRLDKDFLPEYTSGPRVISAGRRMDFQNLSETVIYEDAYKVEKNNLSEMFNKANQAFLDSNYDESRTLLDTILAEDPNYEPAVDLYVYLLCIRLKPEEAEAKLDHYQTLATNKKNLGERAYQVANTYKNAWRDEITLDMAKRQERLLKMAWSDGQVAIAQFDLGILYQAFGLTDDAILTYEAYLKTDDTSLHREVAEERLETLKKERLEALKKEAPP